MHFHFQTNNGTVYFVELNMILLWDHRIQAAGISGAQKALKCIPTFL